MGWKEKQQAKAENAIDKMLNEGYGKVDEEANAAADARDAAMGKGEEELFEKKLSKEEKKALAKAKREAKKKAKKSSTTTTTSSSSKDADDLTAATSDSNISSNNNNSSNNKNDNDNYKGMSARERKQAQALDNLTADHIQVTYESTSTKLHAHTKDIKVGGFSLTFHGKPVLEETDITINYGNRYGLIGPNGSGKSTLMKAIAARAIPIPEAIDIYFLSGEYEACDHKTALQAVFEVQEEVHELEQRAEELNHAMAGISSSSDGDGGDEKMQDIQSELELIYEKLDAMDVNTAQARASQILFGLGFTTKMQHMKTREFSGGWVSLCVAVVCVMCDE